MKAGSTPKPRRTTVSKRKNQVDFFRCGMAAIEATKSEGGGIPAAMVMAKLEAKLAKLAKARQAKAQLAG